MKRPIEFPLADGDGVVFVEVDVPPNEGGVVPAASPGELARALQSPFRKPSQAFVPQS